MVYAYCFFQNQIGIWLERVCSDFKVEGNGNCLFSAVKKSLQIRHSGVAGSRDGDRDLPYYPTRYFRRQVVNWMVENRQKVFVYMDSTLRGPLSYRDYLHNLLRREFWGDEIVLWVISMMWGLKVTVLNSKTLQEYRIRHNSAFKHVDVGLVYNSYSHYSAAGRSIFLFTSFVWSTVVTCYILTFKMLVACLVATLIETSTECGRLWSLAIYSCLKCWSLA